MLSRRNFLNGTLGAGLALATSQQAAAQTPAAPGARKRLIVDAQVHVWKAESPDWPWVPGMKPQMPEPFTIEKLVPLMDEAGVDRAVIVAAVLAGRPQRLRHRGRQAVSRSLRGHGPHPLEEPAIGRAAAEMEGAAGDARRPGDVSRPRRPMAHRRHRRLVLAGRGEGRASRHVPDRRALGRIRPHRGPHPQLTLIADHMGVVGDVVKAGKLADAIEQTASLAKYQNVSVKLSAAANNSTEAYPFRDFLPHIRRLFDACGPQRCYWGTDITNGFDKASYRQRIAHFTEELTFLSEQDKDWVMGRGIAARLGWS
jgi:L-fuconolactonase